VNVFEAEIRLDTTLLRDPFDPGSRLMGVEVVNDKQPRVLRCQGHGLLDVVKKSASVRRGPTLGATIRPVKIARTWAPKTAASSGIEH
jgi:hypothetical protein